MEMLPVFHMNKGEGDTSYAKNCTVQNKILSISKPLVEEAIEDFLKGNNPETMAIADLGCASGPNALMAVSEIIDVVDAKCRLLRHQWSPKFMVYLNDLPGNDFNEVFSLLAGFYNKLKDEKKGANSCNCYVAAVPGSFYGRLLPTQSLHFVHSSSSLHWLSQVPSGLNEKDKPETVNKGKIYISSSSSSYVINAYKQQFNKDFLSFLKSRSEEVISGGRMVLTFVGRRTNDPTTQEACYPWELIAQALTAMVSKGLIEEEKVDSFNVPYYAPSLEELKQSIEEEASFFYDNFQAFEVEWDGEDPQRIQDHEFGGSNNGLTRGQKLSKMHRAVVESMFEHQFGKDIMDELFLKYSEIVDDHLSKNDSKLINFAISLIRN